MRCLRVVIVCSAEGHADAGVDGSSVMTARQICRGGRILMPLKLRHSRAASGKHQNRVLFGQGQAGDAVFAGTVPDAATLHLFAQKPVSRASRYGHRRGGW